MLLTHNNPWILGQRTEGDKEENDQRHFFLLFSKQVLNFNPKQGAISKY